MSLSRFQVPLEALELLLSNSRLYTVILENYPSLLLCRSSSDKQLHDSTGEIPNKSGITMSMRSVVSYISGRVANFNENTLARKLFNYSLLNAPECLKHSGYYGCCVASCNRCCLLRRLKRATETKAITDPSKDSRSSPPQAPTKPVRKMSKKESVEMDPLMTREIAPTVTKSCCPDVVDPLRCDTRRDVASC